MSYKLEFFGSFSFHSENKGNENQALEFSKNEPGFPWKVDLNNGILEVSFDPSNLCQVEEAAKYLFKFGKFLKELGYFTQGAIPFSSSREDYEYGILFISIYKKLEVDLFITNCNGQERIIQFQKI